MKREILFRGKTSEDRGCYASKWFYGAYSQVGESHRISFQSAMNKAVVGYAVVGHVEVIPETIGQYTGRRDCHGVMIFEGDIVRNGKHCGEVKWMAGKCCFQVQPGGVFLSPSCEVVGNVFDNPEMLKGGEK